LKSEKVTCCVQCFPTELSSLNLILCIQTESLLWTGTRILTFAVEKQFSSYFGNSSVKNLGVVVLPSPHLNPPMTIESFTLLNYIDSYPACRFTLPHILYGDIFTEYTQISFFTTESLLNVPYAVMHSLTSQKRRS
jgi:hypothetical protein